MTLKEILNHFQTRNDINDDAITALQNNYILRKELIEYSRENKNRDFALALLNKFIAIRERADQTISTDDLMLACFNLGLQNQIEDCLKIWEAKCIDFDTYCGLDIQLLPFAGTQETVDFLKLQNSDAAQKALTYVTECFKCGDFNDLDEYFSPNNLPWFL